MQDVPFRDYPGVSRVSVTAEYEAEPKNCDRDRAHRALESWELELRELELWELDLTAASAARDWLALLSADECDQAERIRQAGDRQAFVTARGLLRLRLGECLSIAPEDVRFAYGDRGKPAIAPELLKAENSLHFNTSHSGGFALIGLSRSGEIGVDLEVPRQRARNLLRLAKRFFLPPEIEHLERSTPEQQVARFFQYWTCKEAYLKAIGTGLVRLQDATIDWRDDGTCPAPIVDRQGRNWILQTLALRCGYPGAIAIEAVTPL